MASFKLVLFVTILLIVTSSPFKLTGRIIGGQNAETAQFPHCVSLIESTNLQHFCGGSLLSKWHILTAAHCVEVYKNRPEDILGAFGVTQIGENKTLAKVEKISIHPTYKNQHFINDIALLKTIDEINYSAFIQPISLPKSNLAANGNGNATVCGLGFVDLVLSTFESGTEPPVLQHQNTKILSRFECITGFEKFFFESPHDWLRIMNILKSKAFCAFIDVGKGACNGDSGGPLITNDRLIGIVSVTVGCANGYPDLYTNVYEHRHWIRCEMKKMLVNNKDSDVSNSSN